MSCRSILAGLALALALYLGFNLAAPGRAAAQQACPAGAAGGGGYCLPREGSYPDLFYNFYIGGACDGVPAEMYPAPYPTPPLVGHTYYTYQPLMPHEMLYHHRRVYRQYYNYGRGVNRTTVRWW